MRKSYKPDLQNNPVFPRERRYASVIQTVFIAFTYGAVLPMLFWFAAVILIIQYFLDKLLITYFYKQEVQYNDFLNRNMLRVCKYALVPFFLFGGLALHNNFCSIEREPDHLKYTNQQILCQRMWIQPKVMIVTAPLLFALFVVLDVMMVWYEMEDQKMLNLRTMQGEERWSKTSFFSRLNNLARKRLIAEEHYRRTHYNIQMFDDKAFE